jgi:hypothetical protein
MKNLKDKWEKNPVLHTQRRLSWELKFMYHIPRVSDPHLFNADPDPSFFLIADPASGFDDLKLSKIYN